MRKSVTVTKQRRMMMLLLGAQYVSGRRQNRFWSKIRTERRQARKNSVFESACDVFSVFESACDVFSVFESVCDVFSVFESV